MILSQTTLNALLLRSSQKLLTRVDRHRARQGPITIDFRVFRLCRRTRAFITSLLDCFTPKPKLWTRWLSSRRPRSPSENHNVKQPVKPTFSRHFSTKHHSRTLRPRSGVGAGYRSGLPPSQTLKSGKKRFFSARCGWALQRLLQSPIIPTDTLYMGPGPDFNPVWLILPRKTGLRSAKRAFSGLFAGTR